MKQLHNFFLNEPADWVTGLYLKTAYGLGLFEARTKRWFKAMSKLTYSISKKYGIPPSQVRSKEYIMYVDEVTKRRPDIFK